MKVLVTGGAGFIGSHIVDALVEHGHHVAVVDSLSTGSPGNLNKKATFYNLNMSDAGLGEVFEKEKPDIVSHHAAQTVVTNSVADPVFDAQQNILGSLNVLACCVRFGVKKIVYASSGGAVYGEPQYLPVDEKHPIAPLSPYGVSKHTVEHYLHLYSLNQGLNYVVLRYSNVYGPRQNPKAEAGVVAIFTGQMLSGDPPTIFGDGRKTRDYTHVSDVVAANLLAIEKGGNAIYNVGAGVETSDQAIFDALARVTGYSGKPTYSAARPGEVTRICLDTKKIRKELRWQPRFSLEEGLRETVRSYWAGAGSPKH